MGQTPEGTLFLIKSQANEVTWTRRREGKKETDDRRGERKDDKEESHRVNRSADPEKICGGGETRARVCGAVDM